MRSFKNKYFFAFVFLAGVQYLGYFLISVWTKTVVQIQYVYAPEIYAYRGWLYIGAVLFRFAKDALILMVLYEHIQKEVVNVTIIKAISFFYLYGVIINLFSRNSFSYIVYGIREYLFFFTLLLVFSDCKLEKSFANGFLRVLGTVFTINIVCQFYQMTFTTGNNILLAGREWNRFPGLFGGIVGLSTFCLAFAVYIFLYDYFFCLSTSFCLLTYLLITVVIWCTGKRSSLINLAIIIMIWIIVRVSVRFGERFLLLLVTFFMIPLLFLVADYMAQRGSALQTQMKEGRLSILVGVLTGTPAEKLMFGHGMGSGSNAIGTEMLMKDSLDYVVTDGTLTNLIYEYGIIVSLFAIYFFIRLMKRLLRIDMWITLVFGGTLFIQILDSNILENYMFLAGMIVSYKLIISSRYLCRNRAIVVL